MGLLAVVVITTGKSFAMPTTSLCSIFLPLSVFHFALLVASVFLLLSPALLFVAVLLLLQRLMLVAASVFLSVVACRFWLWIFLAGGLGNLRILCGDVEELLCYVVVCI